jgi:hypothetical protein
MAALRHRPHRRIRAHAPDCGERDER